MAGPSPEKEHVIVGTAGHIDHGKTSLVKAITGIDADTLPEEKERGLTIELGFVFLEDPAYEKQIVFIDVPGHEKFIKTMAAGASNIDIALLVIAADEGINVQTREHFDILRLLEVPEGIIALTKSDLVDEARLDELRAETRGFVQGTFLAESPIVPVSSVTGAGVPELVRILKEFGLRVRRREDRGVFRMPIDRVFIIHGFGTVIAGTVLSGRVHAGDNIEVYPEGIPARVRGIQVHKGALNLSSIGRRTALNLQDVKKEDLRRGQCAAAPGSLQPTWRLDAHLHLLERYGKEIKNRERVRVHIGTDEVIGRLALLDRGVLEPGGTAFVQFMLESPSVALPGDRFVIRTFSPLMTVGGGRILDAAPAKHKRFDEQALAGLKKLEKSPAEAVEQLFLKASFEPRSAADIARSLGIPEEDIRPAVAELCENKRIVRLPAGQKETYLHSDSIRILAEKLLGLVRNFHEQNPHLLRMPYADLRSQFLKFAGADVFRPVFDELCAAGAIVMKETQVSLAGHKVRLSRQERDAVDRLAEFFKRTGFNSPNEDEAAKQLRMDPVSFKKAWRTLSESGEIIRLNPKVFYHRETLERAKDVIGRHIQRTGRITIAELRDQIRLSRKFAWAMLEYFDKIGYTKRVEDHHVLK